MNVRPSTEALRDLARKLIELEASAVVSIDPDLPAAARVCEAVRRPLCVLAGTAGFRALLSRALSLAKAKAPGLNMVRISPDGSVEGFSDLALSDDPEAGLVLISELLELMAVLIGQDLTLTILDGVWPDFRNFRAGSNGAKQP
ncbi:MAG: hypothetical protein SGI92_28065 [Bryobacteraceae bacterium]|nr:hypothetical protein [Bryobacteraceae bacterium]